MSRPPRKGKVRGTDSGPRGVQSIGVGFAVLLSLARGKGPMHLREIAAGANMPASKAYRYLVSFAAVGMVKQNAGTAQYDLGPLSIEFGLAALGRMNAVETVGEALVALSSATRHDAHMTVWTNAGPSVIRWVQGPGEVGIRVREGTILPLLTSATGRVWACHAPRAVTAPLIDAELEELSKKGGRPVALLRESYDEWVSSVDRLGLARAEGERRAGINAIAGAIFDPSGIAFGVTLLGAHGDFDPAFQDLAGTALARMVAETSARLGAQVPAFGKKET